MVDRIKVAGFQVDNEARFLATLNLSLVPPNLSLAPEESVPEKLGHKFPPR